MKKEFLIACLALSFFLLRSQTTADLFNPSEVKISWLGVDFSHVKLIGNFAEFSEAGGKSSVQIRDKFFRQWNDLVINEPNKYDIKGMLRKGEVLNDVEDVYKINAAANTENMEAANTPNYTEKDIPVFIKQYHTKGKKGIGIVFIAESLNKNAEEAFYHVVAIDLASKKLLLHKRMHSKPRGIGLRNYWAGSIYGVIKEIKDKQYNTWKSEYH